MEGSLGGGEGTKGWRKSFFGYKIKEYHFWLWYVVVPVFVLAPLLYVGFEPRLFGTLAAAYLVGGVAEDFVYFIVNPAFGLRKWNSRSATWMPWFRLGRFEIPQFYVRNLAGALVVWLVFVWL